MLVQNSILKPKWNLQKKIINDEQVNYHQTVHEENLVKGQTQNKTQWVDTDINGQFGHLGGTSESKRNKCIS